MYQKVTNLWESMGFSTPPLQKVFRFAGSFLPTLGEVDPLKQHRCGDMLR